MRIVSLVPAATEMLAMLGLSDQLVGVSHDCDVPAFVKALPQVTRSLICPDDMPLDVDALVRHQSRDYLSVFEIDVPLLRELRPDLIVAPATDKVCAITPVPVEDIVGDMPASPTIVRMAPCSLDDVLCDLKRLGRITERPVAAARAVDRSQRRIDAVRRRAEQLPVHPEVLFLEWIDPVHVASPWNAPLIQIAGGRDALCHGNETTSISPEAGYLECSSPDLIVVAACGVTFEQAMWEWEMLPPEHPLARVICAAQPVVYFLDGPALFKHPGPRLINGLEQLARAVECVGRSMVQAAAQEVA